MESTRPAITATRLSRTYGYRDGAVRAVRCVDLTVASGCLTALVGPSGAGTSTLLQCLAGTDRGITGRAVRHGVRLPSGPGGGLTRLRPARIVVVGAPVDEPAPRRAESAAIRAAWDSEVAAALTHVGGGDQAPSLLVTARRALVAALAQRPDVVVADEPTADLDAESAAVLIDVLCTAADRLGVTVLVATHDPRLAERAERVLAMEGGRLVADSAEGDSLSVLTGAQAVAPQRRLEPARP